MLPFPDAAILSHYVDGVLPVIEMEKTSVEQLKRMMKQLKGINILGTVLNKNKG
jgi:Mrp family chromosome partitioning ATPase